MENVIIALITGGLSLCGVIFTNLASNKKIEEKLTTDQAVTKNDMEHLKTQISDLTEEVRKHNSFADRITRLEVEVEALRNATKRTA